MQGFPSSSTGPKLEYEVFRIEFLRCRARLNEVDIHGSKLYNKKPLIIYVFWIAKVKHKFPISYLKIHVSLTNLRYACQQLSVPHERVTGMIHACIINATTISRPANFRKLYTLRFQMNFDAAEMKEKVIVLTRNWWRAHANTTVCHTFTASSRLVWCLIEWLVDYWQHVIIFSFFIRWTTLHICSIVSYSNVAEKKFIEISVSKYFIPTPLPWYYTSMFKLSNNTA